MSQHSTSAHSTDRPDSDRRTFLSLASTAAMTTGIVAGYGTLAYMAGRFLYSGSPTELQWLFVAKVSEIKPNEAIQFASPAGHKVTITRRGTKGVAEDFLALSSTCPHLGCQVHWESQNNRFFCPCHNGVFDPTGKATAGPPFEAKQTLPQYPLKIEGGMVFVQMPVRVVGQPT